MYPTIFQITAAIVMIAASLAMVVWFRRYLAAASARRMTCMMTQLGLDPETAAQGDPATVAIMKEARSRCRKCSSEDFCGRWIAGKVKGDVDFVPTPPHLSLLQEPPGAQVKTRVNVRSRHFGQTNGYTAYCLLSGAKRTYYEAALLLLVGSADPRYSGLRRHSALC